MRYDLNVEIPMRDGVVLRADIMRAEDGPQPALLVRTPYSKDSPATRCEDSAFPTEFAKSGYAVVVQDTRGRFTSDGEWGGFDWETQGPDGYDTVEWIAAQPWCNGKVVMSGLSYPGMNALLAGVEQPPHLAAIAVSGVTEGKRDRERLSGAFRLELFVPWLLYMIAQDVLPKQIAAGTATPEMIARLTEGFMNPRAVIDYLPLKKNPFVDVPGSPLTIEELLTMPYGCAPVYELERIKVPTLFFHHWYEVSGAPTIEMFLALRQHGAGGDEVRPAHRLIIGPWVHGAPRPIVGELNFGLTATEAAWRPALESFHGLHSGHHEAAELPVVQYFLMGANEWRVADEWPPPGCETRSLYLHSGGAANTAEGDGELVADPPGADAVLDTYRYDPADPTPTRGGGVVGLGGSVGGPLDQAPVERRSDVLCYTSETFTEAVDVVGQVRLRLHAASSAVDTDFVAKLCDVFPDGRSINVCEGLRRARFRKGMDQEVLLEPGAVEEYEINLGHTAWRVEPGHRLRVQLSSSNYPNLDRNMNTGNALGDDVAGIVAEQTVYHDAQRPSRLEFSVLPGH